MFVSIVYRHTLHVTAPFPKSEIDANSVKAVLQLLDIVLQKLDTSI